MALRLSPRQYRAATFASLVSLAIIVETGALVRLTDSGLGCVDWPNCSQERFIEVSNSHQAVEQLNRLFTGVVAIAVILAVLGSLVRVPKRRDLTWLSLGLVAGVVGQIVLGGITVLTDLHPAAVQGHFLLSMVILANAIVLHRRAAEPSARFEPLVPRSVRRHVEAILGLLGVVIVAGTVVTGTGPHGGDEAAPRFGFDISSVARLHGLSMIVTLAAVLALAWRLRTSERRSWRVLQEPLTALFVVMVIQGAIGYAQYFNGVPVVLVALHIAGSVAVWWVAWLLLLACRHALPEAPTTPGEPPTQSSMTLSRTV
jgi:cytochrome c oxidase assembly protein subunit 15